MSHLLMLNLGTFAETNVFKRLALERGFIAADLMDANPPSGLIVPDGLRTVRVAGTETVSGYNLRPRVWRSRLGGGTSFKDRFVEWMGWMVQHELSLIYIAGHHWQVGGPSPYTTVSWGDTGEDFSVRFEERGQRLSFGCGADRVAFTDPTIRSGCQLVIGFGCDVGTGGNSARYQSFFAPSRPVVLAWDRTITIPSLRDNVSVNTRFLDYIDQYAGTNPQLPAENRLAWLYDHEPMELVRAWGFATIPWYFRQARARAKDGTFYRFQLDPSGTSATPVRA